MMSPIVVMLANGGMLTTMAITSENSGQKVWMQSHCNQLNIWAADTLPQHNMLHHHKFCLPEHTKSQHYPWHDMLSLNFLLCLTSAISSSVLLSSDLTLSVIMEGRYGLFCCLCCLPDSCPFLAALMLWHRPQHPLVHDKWNFRNGPKWHGINFYMKLPCSESFSIASLSWHFHQKVCWLVYILNTCISFIPKWYVFIYFYFFFISTKIFLILFWITLLCVLILFIWL